jgi:ornithine cyclodeaminase
VSLFTDYLPSLEAQAAEVIDARRQGMIAPDHRITEIGHVLRGSALGRRDAAAITLYRSLGVAAQDLAAAQFILERAEQTGRGVVVEMA